MSDIEYRLPRRWLTDETTIGEWMLGDAHRCFILEDVYRGDDTADKIRGETCIPCGRYEVKLTWSPRFQRHMPELVAVPGFHGIRIHPGNTKKDTDGCLCPGLERVTDEVRHSINATEALEKELREHWSANRRTFVTIVVEPEVTT